MEILWRLLFGHMLADFTFQTDFINHWKRTSTKGLLAHCLMHPAFYVVLCWPYLGQVWVDFPAAGLRLNGWACVVLIFLIHLLEDWWRVFAINRYQMPDNTAFFLWDQAVHYAVIFAVAPLAPGSVNLGAAHPLSSVDVGGVVPERWPALGCLFVAATHAGMVLVYSSRRTRTALRSRNSTRSIWRWPSAWCSRCASCCRARRRPRSASRAGSR
jgi:hypothetical protein